MQHKNNINIKFRIWLLLLIVFISIIGIICIYNFEILQNFISEPIKKRLEDIKLYYCVLFISVVFGILHLIFGGSKENTLFIFKKLGPILASPLTGLTYGVVINSSLNIMYIICFDVTTLKKYSTLDQTTTIITVLLLVTWSVAGLYGMMHDIVKKKDNELRGIIYPKKEENKCPNSQV